MPAKGFATCCAIVSDHVIAIANFVLNLPVKELRTSVNILSSIVLPEPRLLIQHAMEENSYSHDLKKLRGFGKVIDAWFRRPYILATSLLKQH